jgi:hypothetical protein
MPIWAIAIVVSLCGLLGGFVNAFLAGSLHLPRCTAETYAPGWMGDMTIGAIAALVLWSLYDPASRAAVIGGASSHTNGILSFAEIAASVAVGAGAARILARRVDKKHLVNVKSR